MKTIPATKVKNQFGAVLDAALTEPVMVQKSGRPSVVMLSVQEYERLVALEDAYWAERATRAEAGGWASAAEVAKLIEKAASA